MKGHYRYMSKSKIFLAILAIELLALSIFSTRNLNIDISCDQNDQIVVKSYVGLTFLNIPLYSGKVTVEKKDLKCRDVFGTKE